MKTESAEQARGLLEKQGYLCSTEVATVVHLALALDKPILVEGPAGVGKTELAKAAAGALGRELIRLQCYEGLDESKALYEWEYGKQLLYTQLLRDKIRELVGETASLREAIDRISGQESAFFSHRFLLPRPLLQALLAEEPAVLLVDEVDKSDPEFEAFLLEVLSDYQVSVPELGTVAAKNVPLVVLTSNNARDMTDALKRRCLYLYLDYPDAGTERRIVMTKVPGIEERLAAQVVHVVRRIRSLDLKKQPCLAETLDWAAALSSIGVKQLDPATIKSTLGAAVKHKADAATVIENINLIRQNLP